MVVARSGAAQAVPPLLSASHGRSCAVAAFVAATLSVGGAAAGQGPAEVDLEHLISRLGPHLAALGVDAWWNRAKTVDGEIWLEEVGLPVGGGQHLSGERAVLGEIALRDGRYRVGRATSPYLTFETGQDRFSAEALGVFGLRVPKAPTTVGAGSLIDFDEVATAQFSYFIGPAEVIAFRDLHLTASSSPEDMRIDYEGAIETIELWTERIQNPAVRDALTRLGYETLKGFLEVGASIQGNPGELDLRQLSLGFDKAGALDFSAAFVSIGQNALDGGGDFANHRSGATLSTATLALKSATIRFDDASLTSKVMNLLAESWGVDAKTAGSRLQMAFGLQFAPYLGPENAVAAAAALQEFLDDPRSLELRFEAAIPAPASEVLDAAAYPQVLRNFRLSVTAND